MADRIVGPLTLVQFLYLLVGGIVVYFLFTTVAPVSIGIFLLLSVPITLFTLAITFLKIQDQTFGKFVRSFTVYITRPKMRVWFKEGVDTNLIITPDKIQKSTAVQHKVIKKSQLDKLIQVLDTGGHAPQVAEPKQHAAAPSRSAAGHHNKKEWRPPTLDMVKR
jgi:hypothetical protein